MLCRDGRGFRLLRTTTATEKGDHVVPDAPEAGGFGDDRGGLVPDEIRRRRAVLERSAGFAYAPIGADGTASFDADDRRDGRAGRRCPCRLSDARTRDRLLGLRLSGAWASAGRMQSEAGRLSGLGRGPGAAGRCAGIGQPACSQVTASSAAVSCTFAYHGRRSRCPRSYFLCGTGGVSTTGSAWRSRPSPAPRASALTGLSASTDYKFRLCVAGRRGDLSRADSRAVTTTSAAGGPGPGPIRADEIRGLAGAARRGDRIQSDYHYAYHTISEFDVCETTPATTPCAIQRRDIAVPCGWPRRCTTSYVGSAKRKDNYSQRPRNVPCGHTARRRSPIDQSLTTRPHARVDRPHGRDTAVMRRSGVLLHRTSGRSTAGRVQHGRRRRGTTCEDLGRHASGIRPECHGPILLYRGRSAAYCETWTDSYGNTASPRNGRLRRSAGGCSDHVLLGACCVIEERHVRQMGGGVFARRVAVRGHIVIPHDSCRTEARTLSAATWPKGRDVGGRAGKEDRVKPSLPTCPMRPRIPITLRTGGCSACMRGATTGGSTPIRGIFAARSAAACRKSRSTPGSRVPTATGTIGEGGCTFCNNGAFTPSYCIPAKGVAAADRGGDRIPRQALPRGVDATWSTSSRFRIPTPRSERLQERSTARRWRIPAWRASSSARAPTAWTPRKLDYLAELARGRYVAVEYGIESTRDETLRAVNRGHDFACARRAVEMAAARGLHVGAHFHPRAAGRDRRDAAGAGRNDQFAAAHDAEIPPVAGFSAARRWPPSTTPTPAASASGRSASTSTCSSRCCGG